MHANGRLGRANEDERRQEEEIELAIDRAAQAEIRSLDQTVNNVCHSGPFCSTFGNLVM
jgi:hypothetical protein